MARVANQEDQASGEIGGLAAPDSERDTVVIAAVGLAAYSLWGFIRAIYDPLHRGSGSSGYAARLGSVTSALSYATIVILALQLLAGSGGAAGDSTQKT